MNVPDRTTSLVLPRKLTLNVETVRRLGGMDEEDLFPAHPTTTVNTVKSGCC
jgi:hypothetical protein